MLRNFRVRELIPKLQHDIPFRNIYHFFAYYRLSHVVEHYIIHTLTSTMTNKSPITNSGCLTGLNSSYSSLHDELVRCQEEAASIIFWNHNREEFQYLTNSHRDNITFNLIKDQLTEWKSRGVLINVRHGNCMKIANVRWYTLLVMIDGAMCYPTFLLSNSGDWDETNWTPFYFTDKHQLYNLHDCLNSTDERVYHC